MHIILKNEMCWRWHRGTHSGFVLYGPCFSSISVSGSELELAAELDNFIEKYFTTNKFIGISKLDATLGQFCELLETCASVNSLKISLIEPMAV